MLGAVPWAAVRRRAVEVVSFVCMWQVFVDNVAELTLCVGPSMLPTFHTHGDMVVMEHFTPRFRRPKLGDVVVARSPADPRQFICKRVLGLPGDMVCVDPTRPVSTMVTIPEGHVWLQGDNLQNSTDSRAYGPVPMGLIKGRVVCRVWPPWYAGWVRNSVQRVPSQTGAHQSLLEASSSAAEGSA